MDHSPPVDDLADFPSKPSRRRRGAGCLPIAVGLFAGLLIFGVGHGFPYTYWLRISEIQAFEAEQGIVLFVEVERAVRNPGLLQEGSFRKPTDLYRVDLAGDGRVRQTRLNFDTRITFNTNIAPIVKLADHFYLVQGRSRGRPSCQLHRVLDQRIVALDYGESDQILHENGLNCDRVDHLFDFTNLDAVSARTGWRRINQISYSFSSFPGRNKLEIAPRHHDLTFWLVADGASESIVAESPPGPEHWRKPLVTVDTTRWKSYLSPLAE